MLSRESQAADESVCPAGKSLAGRFVVACRASAARRLHGAHTLLARADLYDLVAFVVFAALIALIAATFRDYAISNDEEVQQRYGELIVAYYGSGFVDQSLFHFKNLYLYGGLFDVIAVGLEKLLPFDIYATRHLLSALTGVGGIAAVWASARTIAGPRAGLFAATGLALCGVWYGAMFNHTKDIPFAAAMMAAAYFLICIGRELPRPRWRLVVLFGVFCGCALGIRVLGVFSIGYALLMIALHAPVGGKAAWRDIYAFATRSTLALMPAFAIAYAIMIAAWPWAALAPLNPLQAMFEFVNFRYPIDTVLAGHVYRMGDVPRWYVPAYMVIKLTLPLLLGAALALLFAMLPRPAGAQTEAARRKEIWFVAAIALIPIICNVIARGPADTGLRHFLFTLPPIAVLAGIGLDAALRRLEAAHRLAAAGAFALLLLGLGTDATSLYRLHPDEYLFFNPLVGGLAGASRRYATDYWVNVMPEAVRDLEQILDKTDRASADPLSTHRYMVGVCGERLPFEKVADGRLQWTRDWKRADFFIAPTHMNCDLALDGSVIATVSRLGVVIGVVKDRRAITRPNIARAE